MNSLASRFARRAAATRPFSVPLAAALVAAASGLFATACGSAPPEQVVTRDSAGVELMLSNAPAWPPGAEWHLTAEPALTIGGLVGQRRYDFTSVVDAYRIADRRILVAQSNPADVRLYGPDGSFVRAFGVAGPGGSRFVLHAWLAGPDSVLVYDPTLGRLNEFLLDGEFLGSVDVGAAGTDGLVWVGRFGDGSLLGRPNSPPPSENGRTRATFAYTRRDAVSGRVDTVATASGAEYVAAEIGSPRPRVDQVLFSPFTAAVTLDTTVLLADTRDFWIEERASDGRLLRRFGRAFESRRIDRDFIRAYTQQRLAAAGSRARDVKAELERAIFADAFPAHDAPMIVDPAGYLWVLDYPGGAEPDRAWSVFDPAGRWMGEVHVPKDLRLTDVGLDYVLGVWRDADGVQTIRVFDLERTGATPAS